MTRFQGVTNHVFPLRLSREQDREVSNSLRAVANDCNRLAKESLQLCSQTVDKGNEIVDFGNNTKQTLVGIAANMDASALTTIRDLISGDNMKEAQVLAIDMERLALESVKKSVEMINRMQDGLDNLPKVVQRIIKSTAKRSKLNEEETEMANVAPDIAELRSCIDAIENLNLCTAMKAGQNAFTGLASKSQVFKTLFEAIKRFAEAVVTITDAFIEVDVKAVISKIKDILRCIKLSNLMKQFAEEGGQLIKVIIELFQKTSGKLGALWSALAHAKDCMSNNLSQAFEAKKLCRDANNKGTILLDRTISMEERASVSRSVDLQSISSLRSLADGDEIQETINIARGMDDMVVQCTEKISIMIDNTTEGFNNLPGIITDGIPDIEEVGFADEEIPRSVNVEEDIIQLENARDLIENADLIGMIIGSAGGLSRVREQVSNCKDMLTTLEIFADKCSVIINSFMGAWSLEAFAEKVIEICRLVKLGKIMQQYARQTERLLLAIIAFMRTFATRLKSISPGSLLTSGIPDSIGGAIEVASALANNFNLNFQLT